MSPTVDRKAVVEALLDRFGQTYCDEIGIPLARGTPAPLFQWLVAALLFSTRIRQELAMRAIRALLDAGLTTPERMCTAGWEQRVRLLNQSGYARYDERTARMLGDTAALLLERYGGDLRWLRGAASQDPGRERALLEECKGLGRVGVDILFREVQGAWTELYPFADRRTQETAAALGLPHEPSDLARLVPRAGFPRLVAALTRARLARALDKLH